MKSIKMKLTVLICLIALIICLLLTGINTFILYKTVNNDMDTSVNATSKAYSLAIANAISIYKNEIETIASDSRITAGLSVSEISAIRQEYIDKFGFEEVVFATADGITVDGVDISDREYFQKAINGETYISSPLESKKTAGQILLNLAAKVDNGSGYNGIVFAQLSNDVFSQIIKDVSIGNKGYGFVIDKTGTIVAHKDNSLVGSFTNYITMSENDASYGTMGNFISEMLNNQTGSTSVNFEGSQKYIAYTPVSNTDGWDLAMVADEHEMMSSLYSSVLISIIITIAIIIVSFVFAVIFANKIGKPISIVSGRLKLLSEGDLTSCVPEVKSKDETFILADSLRQTTSSLNSYIKDIHNVLSNISTGNLDVNTSQEYAGNFIGIQKDMEEIIDSLNRTITQINTASGEVLNAAEQISNGAQCLAQNSTEQANSVEELLVTMGEFSNHITDTTNSAEKANNKVQIAKEKLSSSNGQMKKLTEAMSEINDTSNKISQIIKTIEDIAFQTNILALNAAVEAARAGSSGKGFAVVAEEVKNLAGKCSGAAKNTSELIMNTISAINNGIRLSSETATELDTAVGEVDNAAKLIKQVFTASEEQKDSIQQVVSGLGQVSIVVQNNSATAEESAASSEELASQANILKGTVALFTLKREDAGAAAENVL
ncbi:MAG: methyl-accepting chemotaxis protein [Oscillospiraceae bacterium]